MPKRHRASRGKARALLNFAIKQKIQWRQRKLLTTPRIINNTKLEPALLVEIIKAIKQKPVKASKDKEIPIEYLDLSSHSTDYYTKPLVINLDSNDLSDAETVINSAYYNVIDLITPSPSVEIIKETP